MSLYKRTVVTALVFLAMVAIVRLRLTTPAPRGTEARADQFSAARALSELRLTIGGKVAHPVGSAANRAVRDRVVARFRAHGYLTSVTSRFVCDAHGLCATVENVLARAPGADPARPVVLLVCHYDSVPAGPGVSDDGAGVAVALEVARALQGATLLNPIAFLVDDGEEAGLLGAEAFVAGGRPSIPVAAVVNLEARGTSGPSFLFETSGDSRRFIPSIGRALPRPVTSSLFAAIYDLLPNDTDLTIFKRAAIPGVNFAFAEDVGNYHTPFDDLSHIDLGSLQHQGDNALASMRSLATIDLTRGGGGRAVWLDLLGMAVLWWPAGVTLPVAAALALIAIVAAVKVAGWRDTALGIAGLVLTIVASGGLAYGVAAAGGISANWTAWPQPLLIAMWITGIAVALAVPILLRGARLGGGYAVGWTLFAVAVAVRLEGASFLFLLPAAALTLTLLLQAFGLDARFVGGLVACAIAALTWFPTLMFLYDMLGAPALPVIAAMAAVVATTFAPLELPLPPGSWRTALVAVILCVASSRFLPAYTASHPRRLNLTYYDDGGSSRWLASSVPPALAEIASFQEAPQPIGQWYRNPPAYRAAAAPALAIPPMLLSREGTLIRLRSQRNADRIALMIRGVTGRLRVNGIALPPRPARFRDPLAAGWQRVIVRGSEATVDVGTGAELEVVAVDTTFGLPPEGRPLAAARDRSNALPSDDGDVTITVRRERL